MRAHGSCRTGSSSPPPVAYGENSCLDASRSIASSRIVQSRTRLARSRAPLGSHEVRVTTRPRPAAKSAAHAPSVHVRASFAVLRHLPPVSASIGATRPLDRPRAAQRVDHDRPCTTPRPTERHTKSRWDSPGFAHGSPRERVTVELGHRTPSGVGTGSSGGLPRSRRAAPEKGTSRRASPEQDSHSRRRAGGPRTCHPLSAGGSSTGFPSACGPERDGCAQRMMREQAHGRRRIPVHLIDCRSSNPPNNALSQFSTWTSQVGGVKEEKGDGPIDAHRSGTNGYRCGQSHRSSSLVPPAPLPDRPRLRQASRSDPGLGDTVTTSPIAAVQTCRRGETRSATSPAPRTRSRTWWTT